MQGTAKGASNALNPVTQRLETAHFRLAAVIKDFTVHNHTYQAGSAALQVA